MLKALIAMAPLVVITKTALIGKAPSIPLALQIIAKSTIGAIKEIKKVMMNRPVIRSKALLALNILRL